MNMKIIKLCFVLFLSLYPATHVFNSINKIDIDSDIGEISVIYDKSLKPGEVIVEHVDAGSNIKVSISKNFFGTLYCQAKFKEGQTSVTGYGNTIVIIGSGNVIINGVSTKINNTDMAFNIRVNPVVPIKSINVKSTNGNIVLSKLMASIIYAQTKNSNIKASELDVKKAYLSCNNGNISVDLDKNTEYISLKTMNGNIYVKKSYLAGNLCGTTINGGVQHGFRSKGNTYHFIKKLDSSCQVEAENINGNIFFY